MGVLERLEQQIFTQRQVIIKKYNQTLHFEGEATLKGRSRDV